MEDQGTECPGGIPVQLGVIFTPVDWTDGHKGVTKFPWALTCPVFCPEHLLLKKFLFIVLVVVTDWPLGCGCQMYCDILIRALSDCRQ